MSCPICEKRPPKRFCPAKGEKICATCCGEEREVTIDCPLDCSYLIAAHRYEAEHRKPGAADEIPYRNVEFSVDFIYERWPQVTGLATTILAFQIQNRELDDDAAFSALEALAEKYRTLGTGIYYERPPDAQLPRALYGQIAGAGERTLRFRLDEGFRGIPTAHFSAARRQAGNQRTPALPRLSRFPPREISSSRRNRERRPAHHPPLKSNRLSRYPGPLGVDTIPGSPRAPVILSGASR